MTHRRAPRGKSLVLTAVLMPVLLAFVAMAVDTGVIATSRAQLQTVADAAALAGAARLGAAQVQGRVIGDADVLAARTAAKTIAAANRVLHVPGVLLDGDIRVGFVDPNDPAKTLVTDAALVGRFNTVAISAARDANRGGVVPSFFGRANPINAQGTAVVNVRARATVQAAFGLRNVGGRASLLPIVLDQTTYDRMIAGPTDAGSTADGQPTDLYRYNDATGAVSPGSDGQSESKLYPVASGNPGNWGTINIGVANNSTQVLGDQIRNGISDQQMATYPNGTIALDSALTPPSITFSGNPGISAGIKDDLISIIGRPVTLPIFDQTGGNGDNAWYRVVKFARVRVLSVNFQGNPKYVIVQPALADDPSPFTTRNGHDDGHSLGPIRLHLSE